MSSGDAPRTRRAFATVAVALVLLYVLVDVVLQFLPPHYSVVSDAESDLAVGPFGWAMSLNFLARAAMCGCVIVAILLVGSPSRPRNWGLVLLAVSGLCSAALVFAPTDVNSPGEYGMTPHTAIGVVHVVFATTGFVAVLAAIALLTAWARRALPRARAILAFAVLGAVGLAALALSIALAPQVVGLAERVCLAGILGWAFVLCLGIRRLA
ncbi:DUF998 domain-containing protein [Lacisediminihabitans sp.]|uniref:DUF998 domain-containing protein n=1 Tax=Lacisediminihabitans sp. TaxID=2787631 RepID=UPI00374DE6F9